MLGRGSGSIGVEQVWAVEHICKASLQRIVAALDTGHDVAIGGRHHACQVVHSTLSMTHTQHIHAYAQSQPMPPKRLVVLATIRISCVKGAACVSVSVWLMRGCCHRHAPMLPGPTSQLPLVTRNSLEVKW